MPLLWPEYEIPILALILVGALVFSAYRVIFSKKPPA